MVDRYFDRLSGFLETFSEQCPGVFSVVYRRFHGKGIRQVKAPEKPVWGSRSFNC
jgi:hypothetical protein